MAESKMSNSNQVTLSSMSYLTQMYGKNPVRKKQEETKNPNRVAGGLKAQSADHLVMVNEDGTETQVPTQRYVQALQEQIRKQKAAIDVLERKLSRLAKESESVQSWIAANQKNRG